jgi:hypothetical protein
MQNHSLFFNTIKRCFQLFFSYCNPGEIILDFGCGHGWPASGSPANETVPLSPFFGAAGGAFPL